MLTAGRLMKSEVSWTNPGSQHESDGSTDHLAGAAFSGCTNAHFAAGLLAVLSRTNIRTMLTAYLHAAHQHIWHSV